MPGHPRVGGGTRETLDRPCRTSGPSPRGRGNPSASPASARQRGAIPAWAGEPMRWAISWPVQRGHPRVGGGTHVTRTARLPTRGPSPRGRGNPVGQHLAQPSDGAIPAWAGEPRGQAAARRQQQGHPRVGGGTCWARSAAAPSTGPSPRGRGNPADQLVGRALLGAIPAWAGEPPGRHTPWRSGWGHPRVGGGTLVEAAAITISQGPSPRGRGNRRRGGTDRHEGGAIPAWAGEPPVGARRAGQVEGHPRVGGGTALMAASRAWSTGPSPRGRGNLKGVHPDLVRVGAIPAWAGEPSTCRRSAHTAWGHPRVGGGTAWV